MHCAGHLDKAVFVPRTQDIVPQSVTTAILTSWLSKQVQAHTFELEEDTSSYGNYIKGGIVTEHKEPKTLDFKPLAQALDDPGEFLLSDFAKMERPGVLHLGFQALNAFQVFNWLALDSQSAILNHRHDLHQIAGKSLIFPT